MGDGSEVGVECYAGKKSKRRWNFRFDDSSFRLVFTFLTGASSSKAASVDWVRR